MLKNGYNKFEGKIIFFQKVLDNLIIKVYYCKALFERQSKYRGVEQLVARRAHNPKVVGSSPSSATKSDTTIDTICASSGIVVLYSI